MTSAPDCVQVALQPFVTVCPDGRANASAHPSSAVVPVFVSRRVTVPPEPQSLDDQRTAQAPGAGPVDAAGVVNVAAGPGADAFPARSVATRATR